jgi:hypothetical protein
MIPNTSRGSLRIINLREISSMLRSVSSIAVVLSLACVSSRADAQAPAAQPAAAQQPAAQPPGAQQGQRPVNRIPRLGIEVPEATKKELSDLLGQLTDAIDELAKSNDRRVQELLPDVQIYQRAVHDALTYNEFFVDREFASAKRLLEHGLERARQLKDGKAPWTTQTGLVVRGYVSKIDGSVQPYGLVVPETFVPTGTQRYRLDLWFHGRGETLSEVNFLNGRETQRGDFTPADTFVLHSYGRYCNAFKFAGEVDVLEGLESVQKRYRIDDDRISVRGFSMGGAACWQFAVHYADRWFACAPGAGFVESEKFLSIARRPIQPPSWERTLWKMYNCPEVAINLYHLPTVAYSGENDGQKAAADIMDNSLKELGISMTHIIGPKMGHQYHPQSKVELDRRLASIAAKGRDHAPREIHFATTTLKYNRMHWVTIDGLEEHWVPSRVDAWVGENNSAKLVTQKVTDLTLEFPSGWAPFEVNEPVTLNIDGQTLAGPRPESDRSFTARVHRVGTAWRMGARPEEGLRKKSNLQGPIDDAFMDSFVFVRPTGKFAHSMVEKWTRDEMEHAIEHWRRQFRGHARVKDDAAVTDADIASSNLVLWGDPTSNVVYGKIADKLPIKWTANEIVVGERRYPASQHAAIAVYPNPLNPARYVVLNSSFTFREFAYLNNADQTPKLPDWAVIDLTTPPDVRFPGKVVAADFFNERWQLKPDGK